MRVINIEDLHLSSLGGQQHPVSVGRHAGGDDVLYAAGDGAQVALGRGVIQAEVTLGIAGQKPFTVMLRRNTCNGCRQGLKFAHTLQLRVIVLIAHREPLAEMTKVVTNHKRNTAGQEAHRRDALSGIDYAGAIDQHRIALVAHVEVTQHAVAAGHKQFALINVQREMGDLGPVERQFLARNFERYRFIEH